VHSSNHDVRVEVQLPRRKTPRQPPAGELFAPHIRERDTGYPGIDLEMCAVRRIAEAHHGHVGVDDRGQVHVLWLELPTV
jgi:hypothetical protein